MRDYIVERALNIGEYIVSSNATVRQTAKKFGVSKSTVHKDVAERLALIDRHLAGRARLILDKNKAERHIRGGQATKRKYKPVIVEENSQKKYKPGMVEENSERKYKPGMVEENSQRKYTPGMVEENSERKYMPGMVEDTKILTKI